MNRRQFLSGVVAAGGVAVAGCSSQPDRELPDQPTGEWPQRGRTATNVGSAAVTVPGRGNRAWNAGDGVSGAPVVADGTVYAVGNDVTAIDARTGEERWSVDLPVSADHGPAVVGDLLLVGGGRLLVAYDRTDGTEEWSVEVPGTRVEGPPTVTADPALAVVPVGQYGVIAYDPRTGARRWDSTTVWGARVAADGDRVYVRGFRPRDAPDDGGRLTAVQTETGVTAWERDTEGSFPAPPPVVTDTGLLVAQEGRLAEYDPESGRRRRVVTTVDGDIELAPAVVDGVAYVASDEGVLAVELADGRRRWQSATRATVDTGVTVTRATVLVSATSIPDRSLPGVAALDRDDGSLRWAHTIEGFDTTVGSSPVPADGAVFYMGGNASGVTALGDLPPYDGGD